MKLKALFGTFAMQRPIKEEWNKRRKYFFLYYGQEETDKSDNILLSRSIVNPN